MLWDRPHVHMHWTSLKAFDSVRLPSIAVDRCWRRQFEWCCNLLMLYFWYRTVPHAPTLPKVMHSVHMLSTVDGVWTHANACKGVSENAALILDCWPLHTAERFETVYRIVSWYFVQYRIISIVFPYSHIVPSLVEVFPNGTSLSSHSYSLTLT